MFADGFSVQRGKIFGFGPNSEVDTNNVLKISSVKGPNKRKLDKAPVTNIAKERSVGYINYELKNIRGRKQLESASKKMIIKKSFDLIEKSYQEDSAMSMSKYVKPAKVIWEIKLVWMIIAEETTHYANSVEEETTHSANDNCKRNNSLRLR